MAQQVRTFTFDAGESQSAYNSYGTMKWQLPIVTYDFVQGIADNAGLTGSGSKTLIDFSEGPTEVYYNMQNAGFNPRAQCRIPLIVQNLGDNQFVADGIWNFWSCWSGQFEWPEDVDTSSYWQFYLSTAEMRAHGAYFRCSLRSPSGLNVTLIDPNNWSGTNLNGKSIGKLPVGVITRTASYFGGIYFPYCWNDDSVSRTVFGAFTTSMKYILGIGLSPDYAEQEISAPWFETYSIYRILFPTEEEIESNPGIADFGYGQSSSGNLDYNPYDPGGSSGTGGFGGSFDNSSDTITPPEAPAWSAPATGFLGIYSPALEQINDLATALNSSNVIDSIKNWFASPIDVIMGFAAYPLNIPKSTVQNIKVGWVETSAQASLVQSQWVVLDCGTIDVQEYWGGFMDYGPYTKISIYLPYCGEYPLDTDDIMGKTLGVQYVVDLLTGVCVASVTVDGSVHYQHTGICKYDMPMSSGGLGNLVSGIMTMIGGSAAAASRYTPGTVASGTAGQNSAGQTVRTGQTVTLQPSNLGITAATALSSLAAGAVMAAKPTVSHTGLVNGNAGLLGIQYPYLIITRPRQAIATNQGKHVGYPLWATKTVGDCEGYTVYQDIHLEKLPFTAGELDELYGILTSGAIL